MRRGARERCNRKYAPIAMLMAMAVWRSAYVVCSVVKWVRNSASRTAFPITVLVTARKRYVPSSAAWNSSYLWVRTIVLLTAYLGNKTGLMAIQIGALRTRHASCPVDLTGVDDRVGPGDSLKRQDSLSSGAS